MKRLLRRKGNERGQALVEFALVIPLFLFLIFGLIDFGRVVYANNAVSQAAQDATRWGSVQSRSSSEAGRTSIADHALEGMVAVPSATVEVTCEKTTLLVNMPCMSGDILVVEVSSDVEMITPIIAQLMQALGANPIGVSATSQVVVSN